MICLSNSKFSKFAPVVSKFASGINLLGKIWSVSFSLVTTGLQRGHLPGNRTFFVTQHLKRLHRCGDTVLAFLETPAAPCGSSSN